MRLARAATPMSARALSIRAGLSSAAHVGLIERGTVAQPSGATLQKLAAALGVSMEWLQTGEGAGPAKSDGDAKADDDAKPAEAA